MGHESTSKHSKDLKIIWTEDLRFVPREASKTPFILAHEFFDALPVHVFQSVAPPPSPPPPKQGDTIETPTGPIPAPASGTRRLPQEHQWRELMVSPTPPHRLKEGEPEFELSMAKAATPHSMYLPELSARYRALKRTEGATIEVSPESLAYAREFAVRLGGSNPPSAASQQHSAQVQGRKVPSAPREEPFIREQASGAALIIDYGPAGNIPANSLRGIKAHARVSPFHSPGTTDVSADVDLLALAESAITSSPGVEVHGPVDQARFLTAMGIEERAAQLVKKAVDAERAGGGGGKDKGELTEIVKRIETGWRRLVDVSPNGMGGLYQVMAVVPYAPSSPGQPRRRPVGFGGDIAV